MRWCTLAFHRCSYYISSTWHAPRLFSNMQKQVLIFLVWQSGKQHLTIRVVEKDERAKAVAPKISTNYGSGARQRCENRLVDDPINTVEQFHLATLSEDYFLVSGRLLHTSCLVRVLQPSNFPTYWSPNYCVSPAQRD